MFLALCGVSAFLSCSSNFDAESWEGAVFVSTIDYNGNDFYNDNARIELLSDSVCEVMNLSFVEFSDSTKWPKRFTGEWYLYEIGHCKYLNISYQHKSISFNVVPAAMFGDWTPRCVSLHYYIGDPDDMTYHVLRTEEAGKSSDKFDFSQFYRTHSSDKYIYDAHRNVPLGGMVTSDGLDSLFGRPFVCNTVKQTSNDWSLYEQETQVADFLPEEIGDTLVMMRRIYGQQGDWIVWINLEILESDSLRVLNFIAYDNSNIDI